MGLTKLPKLVLNSQSSCLSSKQLGIQAGTQEGPLDEPLPFRLGGTGALPAPGLSQANKAPETAVGGRLQALEPSPQHQSVSQSVEVKAHILLAQARPLARWRRVQVPVLLSWHLCAH